MLSVLLVCTANICRSPMAEALLKHLVSERPDSDQWTISSAGTWARPGIPASIFSQVAMQEKGLDIRAHQSQPVTEELLSRCDLVLTMESQQKEGLSLQFPQYSNRIYMLSEMVGPLQDVPDPIGGELSDYQTTARLLERYLSGGLERIYQLASRQNIQPAA